MADVICKLQQEMILQFLSRLPPKSLMRFKCIHKSWYALINNPMFIDNHLQLYNKNSYTCFLIKRTVVPRSQTIKEEILFSLLYVPNDDDSEESHPHCIVEDIFFPPSMGLKSKGAVIELPGTDDIKTIHIVGHCDGIICLLVHHTGDLVFYNPSIRELKILPPSCLLEPFYCTVGFGYDPKCKDYKVVNIVESGEDSYDHNQRLVIYPPRAEVYNLGTDSWRQIKIDYLETETSSFWPDMFQMCFKGVFYWMGHEQDKEYLSCYDRLSCPSIRDVIILYDTSEEVFRTRLLPESFRDLGPAINMNLTVWNASITLFGFSYLGPDIESFKIWMMDEFGNWTKHLTYDSIMGIYLPLVLWSNDEVLMVADDGRILSYSLRRDRVKYFPVQGAWGDYQGIFCVNPNSIVSVKGGNKVET